MSDHSELKRLLEACKESNCADASDFGRRIADLYDYLDPEAVAEMVAESEALKAEVDALTKSTGAAMFLTLTEELAALRKKLTTVHFVCDRLPDQDGCRFIELENPQGESLGDESGKWEIRPDGLAQLVVEIASPDVKRMAALLECAQGDLKQAMKIIEKDSKPLDDLIAENEVLCSKIASMNISGFGEAFYQVAERLGVTGARPVSPMQVFTSEVLPALDAVIKDSERLNWLDKRSVPVVEGQCMSQPEGELWGYDWGVAGQCSTVREAIDYAMEKEAGK